MPIFYERVDGNRIRAGSSILSLVGGPAGLAALPSTKMVVRAYDFPDADEAFTKLSKTGRKLAENCFAEAVTKDPKEKRQHA